MKKTIVSAALSMALVLSVSASVMASNPTDISTVGASGQSAGTTASSSAANLEAKEVVKYYSLTSYEETEKEAFVLNQGEELTVFVYNSGFPITYTVYDADGQALGTYNTNTPYGRIFTAQKNGPLYVQFKAGANSSFVKKMNFSAKFSIS
ncbi:MULTISPECIES: hypothetical protein [Paenibacillus]|uniref:hypothetical protein n=1 Tax=Paenibacillus TaxID=44249 RepID=UPI001C1F27B9|nr:hypothetical protein [Paenibacillus oleatilyticus]MBU7319331.1 hypothetical protein [Paenibacillus oleatilyticus]GMX62875.1 hypothetical protein Elgi_26820 [Paenibacillus elgii]